jgi:tetratricopeptide (TPR) repeat protein
LQSGPLRLTLGAMAGTLKRAPCLAALCGVLSMAAAPADDEARYDACMELRTESPARALEEARRWQDDGGGTLARHCEAMALLALGHKRDAAALLEELAYSLDGDEAGKQVDLMAQAGQAWLLAGDYDKALAIQTLALDLAPDDPALLVDRAVTQAEAGRYESAVDDLNRADELAPDQPEILLYRATANRYLDRLDLALADVKRVLELKPDAPAALLERGMERRLTGDDDGARQDWLRVLELAPDGEVGDLARANLEKLDVKNP